MMKRVLVPLLSGLLLAGCLSTGTDSRLVASGVGDVFKAATLTDDDMRTLGVQAAKAYDAKYKVASAKYTQRLNRLVAKHGKEDGLSLNYKVYASSEVNAFVLPDGSIRVYSALMDMMNDDELRWIIGHEIGHAKHGHAAARYKAAYLASAARKGVAASNSAIGDLAAGESGALVEAVLNSQYSQSNEHEADAYGLAFMRKYGYNAQAEVSALTKIAALGDSSSILSTHPASSARANRMREQLANR